MREVGEANMDNDMKLYYDYTVSPLGRLFYRQIFGQLEEFQGKKILDFGSGFAFTTNFLAKNNEVTALELDENMIAACEKSEKFEQIHGDLSALADIPDQTFDVITCHLVLEFLENPRTILDELVRLLKDDGVLSIVRHNKNGRIIQAVVQDYDIADASKLLDGGYSYSSAFGDIKYYENQDLLEWLDGKMMIDKVSGARVLASLHGGETQKSEDWVEKMYAIESKLMKDEAYLKIAYFNHVFLKKVEGKWN